MFLQLAHTKLDVYSYSRSLVAECYRVTQNFPKEERFALTQQIRRAVMSVHLNIAEGCSRKSLDERKRFYEISRGSLIEVDAAFEIAVLLKYSTEEDLVVVGKNIINTFKVLTGMIN